MRLQLISFAWRILNMPVADFAAVNGVRNNSIRKLMEREEPRQPPAPALPQPRGSNPPGFGEKSQENENKSYRLQSVFAGSPPRSASVSHVLLQGVKVLTPKQGTQLAFHQDPHPGSQPARLGSAGVFHLVSVPAGLAPERIKP